MKNWRTSMENMQVGSILHESNLGEEMMELMKLRTAIMVEKCLSKNEAVMCPKPRRQHMRLCGEYADQTVGAELSDIFISKASPPFYSGSPPVRASNPLIQDARFREQRGQENPILGVWMESLDNVVDLTQRNQSISTMA
ncbi:hypothetical protein BVC80_8967g42 [Macleaya cordata]|uniref:Uncharacterized protein n=1 Tax=Macleaya cordata TaxID=56857 RepID=A0A200PLZ8_MACCD|nr:hypothetical protein BVC80_8967g42 [Macleaya cordata]